MPKPQDAPRPHPAALWLRRHLEKLVVGIAALLVLVLIVIVGALQGRSFEFNLQPEQYPPPSGHEHAFLDARYAAGVSPGWPTDEQVLGLSANREVLVTQSWTPDLTPGLVGRDLYTGEPRWQLVGINCRSQGFDGGRAACAGGQQIVQVDLDSGTTTPLLDWPGPIDGVQLAGWDESHWYLVVREPAGDQLVAVDSPNRAAWLQATPAENCELLTEVIACLTMDARKLVTFAATDGKAGIQLSDDNGIQLAADGYLLAADSGWLGHDFAGGELVEVNNPWPAEYPAAPPKVHLELAALASRATATTWDASGRIRHMLSDGQWRTMTGDLLPGSGTPLALSADGQVGAVFGNDEAGNHLWLVDAGGRPITEVSDEPAEVHDGILVADWVVVPPAGR